MINKKAKNQIDLICFIKESHRTIDGEVASETIAIIDNDQIVKKRNFDGFCVVVTILK